MNITSEVLLAITKAASCKTQKAKVETLTSYKSLDLTTYLFQVLDPQHVFYQTVKKLPKPEPNDYVYNFNYMMQLLRNLSARDIAGNAARSEIAMFLGGASPELRTLFTYAIDRKLPGSLGKTLVNKAFPGLIYKQPYGGVKAYDPDWIERRFNWSEGVLLQEKADGLALFLTRTHYDTRSIHTRQGQDVTAHLGKAMQPIFDNMPLGTVQHYEALMRQPDGFLFERAEANGQFTAIIKGELFVAPWRFDMILLDTIDYNGFSDLADPTPCKKRLCNSMDFLHKYDEATHVNREYPAVRLPLHYTVYSSEEAREVVRGWVAQGMEGGVLKDREAGWKDGKMTSQMKLKNEFECTLRVIDWIPHKRHPTWVGSLVCQSGMTGGDKIRVNVGSGLNEDPNSIFYRCAGPMPFLERMIEVKSECITKHKALQHPRITDIRLDKVNPDSYAGVVAAYQDSISLVDP